ncbi:hypothetical protein U9M48_027732 [Paspalum notatum var. saurae]|uniref:Uncharacterized protein n=1 Tax=Paspalum notatum var. saurae TaxID=547442 RepID=A0AAQ3TVR4_PASNO
MSVTEYCDKFLQLARYAPTEVAEDGDKQEHFLEGLNDNLQLQLMNNTFNNFNHLVDRALLTEQKRREIDEKKRKLNPAPSNSNTRPRYPQQYQQQTVNTNPATMLFDTGATHSFITRSYAEQNNIPISYMKRSMVVASPGGEINTSSICSRVGIKLRGVEFSAKLIVIDSMSIDIILGMDTLEKWGVKIDCAQRTVHLAALDGQEVGISASSPSGYLHQMEARPTDGIRIVCDYPDVFPDELPGRPPDRDIEFLIELLPGTAPIAMRQYRMAPIEHE